MGKLHECDVCGYTTQYITNMRNHLKAIKTCAPMDNPQMILMNKRYFKLKRNPLQCEHCNKMFNHRSTAYNHMKLCSSKNQLVPHKPDSDLESSIWELAKKIQELSGKLDSEPHVIQKQINTQININAFGHESLSHITPEILDQCVRRTSKGHLELVNLIYNQEKSNWNIKYTSRPNYLLVWNGSKYECRLRNEVYDAAIDKSLHLMKEYYDTNIENYKSKYSESFVENIELYILDITSNVFPQKHKVQLDMKEIFKRMMQKRENIIIPDTDDEDD